MEWQFVVMRFRVKRVWGVEFRVYCGIYRDGITGSLEV